MQHDIMGPKWAPVKHIFVGVSQHSAWRKNGESLSADVAYAPQQNLFSDSERFDIEAGAKRLTYDKTDIVDFEFSCQNGISG